ncbi:MAG: hypothetical protein HDR24_13715 [Lachnospiraceae bacterium]|nr:hypothetical protein [Lachnospiraceae bacterium]
MKISISMNLQITAKPKNNHYEDLNVGEGYPVKMINMGQSSMSVLLEDKRESYNSVHFDFYLGEKEIDIYKSGLINGYRTLHLPGIWYVDGKDGRL